MSDKGLIMCPMTGEVIHTPVMSLSGEESRLLTDFENFKLVGSGSYGKVMKCRNKLDKGIYAVKEISLKKANMPFKKILREVIVLCCLHHPHVVRYYQAWLEGTTSGISDCSSDEGSLPEDQVEESNLEMESPCLYIQMEFCPSTLSKILDPSADLFDEQKAWGIFHQIVDGVAHIHSAGIVHRDLSQANIFLDASDNVKIGDFGLAKLLETVEDDSMTGSVGTVFYRAPEVDDPDQMVDTKADIYSLGVIFFELFHPFSTKHERIEVLKTLRQSRTVPTTWKFKKLKDFLQNLLSEDPAQRQSAFGILEAAPWRNFSVGSLDTFQNENILGSIDETAQMLH